MPLPDRADPPRRETLKHLARRQRFRLLIDFGIARAADETALTATGGMIGTLHYMAPERFRAGDVDARADIYALACVLYECLTGRRPYPGERVEQQLAAHLSEPPPRPSSTRPEVPAEFDAVIAKGMAKTPDERYATTVDLARAASEAITTPIPRPAVAPPTQPARTPDIPAAVTEPLVPSDMRRAEPPDSAVETVIVRPPNPPRKRRLKRWAIISGVVLILLVLAGVVAQRMIYSKYFIAESYGNVVVMRGINAAFLGYSFYGPYSAACMDAQGAVQIARDAGSGCRVLRVNDLSPPVPEQVRAGLPSGSLPTVTSQLNGFADSLLPLCGLSWLPAGANCRSA